jgi:hypothetical protein
MSVDRRGLERSGRSQLARLACVMVAPHLEQFGAWSWLAGGASPPLVERRHLSSQCHRMYCAIAMGGHHQRNFRAVGDLTIADGFCFGPDAPAVLSGGCGRRNADPCPVLVLYCTFAIEACIAGATAGSSSSEVLRISALSLARAHANDEPHRYKTRGPNFTKGGPPPREALVLSVAGDVGNPAADKAAAFSLRPRRASGSVGTMCRPCEIFSSFEAASVCALFDAE